MSDNVLAASIPPNYIQRLLGDEEITFDQAYIASLAQDHGGMAEDCGRLFCTHMMIM